MEEGGASSSARFAPPRGFGCLTDVQAIGVLARVPFLSHGAVQLACRRFRELVTSASFRNKRNESGCIEEGVVVAGGYEAGVRRRVAECAMLVGSRWQPIAPMSAARSQTCSAVLDGELFVLGGKDNHGTTLTTVEAYDPQTNKWRVCAPMSTPRWDAVCGAVRGLLVVAGGVGKTIRTHTSAEAFNNKTGRWKKLPKVPHPAYLASAVVLNDRLFVAGGMNSVKLQVWDGSAWSVAADLPSPRISATGAASDDGVMIIGGGESRQGEGPMASVVLYNLQTGGWTAGPPMPASRHNCKATRYAGGILVLGGFTPMPPVQFCDGEWTELPAGSPWDGETGAFSAGTLLLG